MSEASMVEAVPSGAASTFSEKVQFRVMADEQAQLRDLLDELSLELTKVRHERDLLRGEVADWKTRWHDLREALRKAHRESIELKDAAEKAVVEASPMRAIVREAIHLVEVWQRDETTSMEPLENAVAEYRRRKPVGA